MYLDNTLPVAVRAVRHVVYGLLGGIDQILGKKNNIVILTYHSIVEDQWRYSVPLVEFMKQVAYMASVAKPVTLSDIARHIGGYQSITEPSFVVTFDDGYKSVMRVREFLKALGVKPTVFVLTNRRKLNESTLGVGYEFLSEKELNSLRRDGWEVGSHGDTHAVLTKAGKAVLTKEIKGSKKKLERKLRSKVKYFAYPLGRYSQVVLTMVQKAGYELAVSMDDAIVATGYGRYSVPRVGVDRSHSLSEFQVLASPLVVKFRSLIKHSVMGKYL